MSSSRSYLVTYTAFAGQFDEFEIQGKNCRILSELDLGGTEIAEEIAYYIQKTDGLFVNRVIIHSVA